MSATDRSDKDWFAWHEPYDKPDSPLSQRLAMVQRRIREAFDARGAAPTRVISMCAGQGRDLLPVLAERSPRLEVTARLVEADAANVAIARQLVADAGLVGVEVVHGDASYTDVYDGFVPADLVLVCGVFGNLVDGDIENTIRCLPQLCALGATVVWTRHRKAPDATPAIRQWFAECGFAEVGFDGPGDFLHGVGTNRFEGRPQLFEAGTRLFDFVGPERARRSRS